MGESPRSSADVGKVYDGVSAIADAFGDGQFHLGYWYDEQDDTPIVEASQRISHRVADSLGVGAGSRILDAGCGPGATAILIARETGAHITGISVSTFDVTEAERRAKAEGLEDQLHFQIGDYSSLEFDDGSFDAVIAIESLLSAPDLDHVLGEFNRVLRPGGRVALCHCTLEARLNPEQAEQFAASISAKQLPTLPEWTDALRRAGFLVDEYTQCGPRVYGMGHKYVEAVEAQRAELVEKFGEDAISAFGKGLTGFFGASPKDVGYAIVAGHKPLR
jgi:cyclopropane fatty-acyl-phospholipid synthase-like methyltransferase